jgi:DnaJ-class molecular chaperone
VKRGFTPGRLPYDDGVARCYQAFDLPYGASLADVDRRFQDYLAKCHPDRHRNNPDLLSDAFKLTGILSWAHGEILSAWQRLKPPRPPLPYIKEIADCYQALDLPYGAPLDQVAQRWKEYLKKVHPDRFAGQPDKIPDATRLSQLLTQAHEKIKAFWRTHPPEDGSAR